MAEHYTGYEIRVSRDTNIYSLTYGDEKKDMLWNPSMCKPDTPVPPEPTDKKEQSIVWNQQITDVYVDESVELIAYATSELPVTFRIAEGADKAHMLGNMLVCDAEGLVVVVAEQEGNDEYYPALDVLKSFNIKHQEVVKKPQTITWNQNFDVKEGDMIQLNAVASSGLPITYRVVSGNEHVSLENNVITALSEGSVVISAHQFGNDEYEAAEAVTKGFYVEKHIGYGGKLILELDKNFTSDIQSGIKIELPQNGEQTVMWECDDVEEFISHSESPWEDKIRVTIPFELLTGNVSDRLITWTGDGNKAVVGLYFPHVIEVGHAADFSAVHNMNGAFMDLPNIRVAFLTDSDNDITNADEIYNLTYLFKDCHNFAHSHMDNLDLRKNISFQGMYWNCYNLTWVDFRETKFPEEGANVAYNRMFENAGRDVEKVTFYMGGCSDYAIETMKKVWVESGNDINKLLILN